jgi:hypothetical protein
VWWTRHNVKVKGMYLEDGMTPPLLFLDCEWAVNIVSTCAVHCLFFPLH